MDFKNYVRMMLEAEKAEDQDKKKAEDQDEEDETDDDEEDDDEDAQASVRTRCTGCEASADADEDDGEDDEDDDSEDEDDGEDDEDDDEEKKSSCKTSLKESMIYSARALNGYNHSTVLSEETRVLVEGINNNSASKYLAKLAKRAEKEGAKFAKKGWKEEAAKSKKAASALKEASNKLYRCETRYKAGDVSAKKEYKQVCRQYSKELKNIGKGARGLKGLIFTVLAGSLLLGSIGVTAAANDDIIDKLNYGFQNKEKMPGILKGLAINDKNAIADILGNLKNGDYEKIGADDVKGIKDYESGYEAGKGIGEKIARNAGKAKDAVKKGLDNAKEHAGDKYLNGKGKITDWKGEKADWEAQKDGWDDVADRENNFGYKAGKAFGKGVKSVKKGVEEFGKEVKKTSSGIGKGFKAGN